MIPDFSPSYRWDRVRRLVSRFPGTTWFARRTMLAGNRVLQGGFQRRFGATPILNVLGFQMALDLKSLHDFRLFRNLRSSGLYEPETSRLLQGLIRSGDTFVDVGANNGYFALLAATLVTPAGRVFAIEPNPGSFERLMRNIRLNRMEERIQALGVAVGPTRGTARLFVNRYEDGWTSLNPHTETTGPIEVPLRPLDEIVSPAEDLIVKVDVEGGELGVLQGMEEIFRRTKNLALIIEWNRTCGTRELWDRLSSSLTVRNIVDAPTGYALLPVGGWEEIRRTLVTNLLCTRGRRFDLIAG
ncbi:MAG: FkbM family methyltransferase [Thermoplasmata archaeon]|nr:FkbM family methyltransferase [Thermoplasmata archaeon]